MKKLLRILVVEDERIYNIENGLVWNEGAS